VAFYKILIIKMGFRTLIKSYDTWSYSNSKKLISSGKHECLKLSILMNFLDFISNLNRFIKNRSTHIKCDEL